MKSDELKNKKIVIAPFNTEAVILYHQLICDGIEVISFMDADLSLHSSNYMQTMITPYFHYEGRDVIAVIATPGYVSDEEICRELTEVNYADNEILRQRDIEFNCSVKDIAENIDLCGLSEIRNLYWIMLLKSKIYQYTVQDGLSIQALNLLMTTRCTLKCKGCCALMDYFHPGEQRDMSLVDTIKAFDMLMEHLDFVYEVVPIGGETFLYKELDQLLIHIASSPYINKIGRVVLITNGTVLPSKEVLEIIGRNRHLFQVWVSDYGYISSKRLELVTMLNQYNCFYMNHVHDTWYLTNQPVVPRADQTKDEIKEKCDNCNCRKGGALRIVENKVYSCHFVAFAAECHAIPQNRQDYLDIHTDCISKEILRKFEKEIHPGMAYCDSSTTKDKNNKIPVGGQAATVHECIRYDK